MLALLAFRDKVIWPEGFRARESALLILLFLWMILCSFFSVHKGHSAEFLLDFLKVAIAYFSMIAFLSSRRDLRNFAKTMLLAAGTLGLTCLLNGVSALRSSVGTMYDPNDISMLFITCFPFVLWCLRKEKRVYKAISAITVAGAGIGMVSAQSRMGFLSLILLGVLYVFRHGAPNKGILKRLVFVGGFALFFLTVASPAYWDRMSTIFEEGATGSGRTVVWKRGLKMVAENPIFGVGPGAFASAYGRKLRSGEFELVGDSHYDRGWKTAHNTYLLIWAEVGLPGLLIYVSMISVCLRGLWKMRGIRDENFPSVSEMAITIEISFVLFLFCAFFISEASSHLFVALLASGVLLRKIVYVDKGEMKEETASNVCKGVAT